MSGELQTIPARHGVATFVPRGRTIKVINTYGKQVVSMWAFSLGAPPEKDEDEEEIDAEKVKEQAEGLKKAVEEGAGKETAPPTKGDEKEPAKEENPVKEEEKDEKKVETTVEEKDGAKKDAEDLPNQALDGEKSTESADASAKQASKRTWASYLPSIPYRNKGAASKPDDVPKPNAEEEKAQNEANTKKWSSYIPTGKSFSSYVPNVQLPDSKEAVSSFKSSHYRDPNKSYAEQLYDFSKTPVGAGTIAAATGSGYASSVYAAYSAYTSINPSGSSQPPMEYLSLPHTRASSHKLVPEVDDELLTNLRNPIITFVEDTSPGAHDTLTAACDANLYTVLGVDKPEEHGSCAENLVLALKELNETAGLKGAKAIGADISVNIAPTPLHLFMNAPLEFEHADAGGAGAKGISLKVEEPKGKKRDFVRFRAERDVVVVLSACPMDVGSQNGGRCMAANFMVEDVQEGEDLAASVSSTKAKKAPKKLSQKGKEEEKTSELKDVVEEKEPEKKKTSPKKDTPVEEPADEKDAPAATEKEEKTEVKDELVSEESKPKKKPRKLQPRSGSSAPAKSA